MREIPDRILDAAGSTDEAWRRFDPDGSIRRENAREENEAQKRINAAGLEVVRDIGRAAQIARIEMEPDPKKRESELNRFHALERIREKRKSERS